MTAQTRGKRRPAGTKRRQAERGVLSGARVAGRSVAVALAGGRVG
jgi:hypothetical protein